MNRQILLVDAVRIAFRYKLDYLNLEYLRNENSLNCESRTKDLRGWFRSVCKDLTATDKEIEELTAIFFEPV